jgi:hypothetical protein
MNALFLAHSGLRYLILLDALIALGVFFMGQVKNQPFGPVHRMVGTAYASMLHLQATLGLVMVALGRFYPALIGHIAMMLTAAVVMQVLLIVNRKRPQPGFVLPIIGVVVSLLLITGGIMAIGRGLFQSTPMAS